IVEAVSVVAVKVIRQVITQLLAIQIHPRLLRANADKHHTKGTRKPLVGAAILIVQWGVQTPFGPEVHFVAIGGHDIIEREMIQTGHRGEVPYNLAKNDVGRAIRYVLVQFYFDRREGESE